MAFASPHDLVLALHADPASGRLELQRICHETVTRLVERLRTGFQAAENPERLGAHAFCWLEMYLRTRKPAMFENFGGGRKGWDTFCAYITWVIGRRLLWEPRSPRTSEPGVGLHRPPPLQVSERVRRTDPDKAAAPPCFEAKTFCRPCKSVAGDYVEMLWFDDTLWVVVADAAGKSWPAFLVIQGVARLWKTLLRRAEADPAELLESLDRMLQQILPDGLFVEMTVGRFGPACSGLIVAAGGSKLILWSPRACQMELIQLSGRLLGVEYPKPFDRHCFRRLFSVDEEVTLASDGVYDQPVGSQRFQDVLLASPRPRSPLSTLHEAVVATIESGLGSGEQCDDISVVTVRCTGRSPESFSTGAGGMEETQAVDPAPPTDDALVRAYLGGDKSVERELFERVRQIAWRVVRRIFGPHESAEWDDACQVVVIHLFDKLRVWRGADERSFRSFAYVVATREAIGLVRRRSPPTVNLENEGALADRAIPPDPGVQECIESQVARFNPKWRLAFRLRREGKTYKEIAQRFDRTVHAVQLWFHAMYRRLIRCLRP